MGMMPKKPKGTTSLGILSFKPRIPRKPRAGASQAPWACQAYVAYIRAHGRTLGVLHGQLMTRLIPYISDYMILHSLLLQQS